MKTLKELMLEYKEVNDTFPDSEAKVVELKRINDEALELHKVSLEPKKVEVADSPLKNIKAVEKTITDNATQKETKIGIELDDRDRDLYLQDFYSNLNPMSNVHDSFEKGMEHFDKVSRADISTLRSLRTIRSINSEISTYLWVIFIIELDFEIYFINFYTKKLTS